MIRIGIWERDEGIFRAVRRACEKSGGGFPYMVSGRYGAEFTSMELEIFAVSERSARECRARGGAKCACLLLPGEAGVLAKSVPAAQVVSYGASQRDTLTFSSREREHLTLAIRRSRLTARGEELEEQELVLPAGEGNDMGLLAASGILLLLGIPPQELPALLDGAFA